MVRTASYFLPSDSMRWFGLVFCMIITPESLCIFSWLLLFEELCDGRKKSVFTNVRQQGRCQQTYSLKHQRTLCLYRLLCWYSHLYLERDPEPGKSRTQKFLYAFFTVLCLSVKKILHRRSTVVGRESSWRCGRRKKTRKKLHSFYFNWFFIFSSINGVSHYL